MAVLNKSGITNSSIIQASHITQSIDALTGQVTNYDIVISGSLGVTGSFGVRQQNINNRVFYRANNLYNVEQHFEVSGNQDWIIGQDGSDNRFKISSNDDGFANANVRLSIDDSTGNVGIGITSSLAKLHVSGNARINDSLTIASTFSNVIISNSGDFAQISPFWGTRFTTNGHLSGIMLVGNNIVSSSVLIGTSYSTSTGGPVNGLSVEGSVGIGTTSPQGPLHIKGTSNGGVTPVIFLDSNGTNNNEPADIRLASGSARGIRIIASSSLSNIPGGASIQFYSNNASTFGGQFYIDSGTTGSSAIIFRTANTAAAVTERMRIAGDGTVSITGSLATTSAITSSGAISSSAGLFGTTLTTTSNATVSGTLSLTKDLGGSTQTIGQGHLYLAGGGSSANRIDFQAALASAPTLNATSTGTKIVLYPNANTTTTDYAIGIEPGATWFSIPSASSTFSFKFYGGTTSAMTVRGDAILTLTPQTTWPPASNPPSGSLAISGSGNGMRLMLWNGGTWTSQT